MMQDARCSAQRDTAGGHVIARVGGVERIVECRCSQGTLCAHVFYGLDCLPNVSLAPNHHHNMRRFAALIVVVSVVCLATVYPVLGTRLQKSLA